MTVILSTIAWPISMHLEVTVFCNTPLPAWRGTRGRWGKRGVEWEGGGRLTYTLAGHRPIGAGKLNCWCRCCGLYKHGGVCDGIAVGPAVDEFLHSAPGFQDPHAPDEHQVGHGNGAKS